MGVDEPADDPAQINRRMNVLLVRPESYLGVRLTQRLLGSENVRLRLLVQDVRRVSVSAREGVDIVEGDIFDKNLLARAFEGIDVAYFPIRFFGTDKKFIELSQTFANQFLDACIRARVKRIVYLGVPVPKTAGIAWTDSAARIGEIVSSCPEKIRTVWFRAGFVVGSGSALFEVLRNLIQKSPVLLIPQWMGKKINPIGVDVLLEYLVRAKDIELKENIIADIGMPAMSFREMLTVSSGVMGLKRFLIPLPVRAYGIFRLLLVLLTPLSFSLASVFTRMLDSEESLLSDTGNRNAREYFPGISTGTFRETVGRAVKAVEKEQVISRWTDSLAGISYSDDEYDMSRSVYRDVKKKSFGDIPPQNIFRSVKAIGGRRGWFTFDFLWRVRGLMDKFMGGFGTSLGKRVDSDVRVGDMVDVWKVVDLKEDRRLLLEAQMKVFGKAWLEFIIDGNTLIQTAYHYPKGLMGRLYWYSMLPFHVFIFTDMINSILRRAREEG
jgi:uncharacterized protein YbjT (DUF2867 family)